MINRNQIYIRNASAFRVCGKRSVAESVLQASQSRRLRLEEEQLRRAVANTVLVGFCTGFAVATLIFVICR